MKKLEAINLYNGIKELKNGNMGKDFLYPFIKLRIKMKELVEEFEQAKEEFMEQSKPENFKEGDDMSAWNKVYTPLIMQWLQEEFECDRVLSFEEAVSYSIHNDINGSLMDDIVEYLVIKEKS